ncbi:def4247a-fe4b-41ec-8b5b-ed2021feecd5-CDS [Sclerotinia trifoliorum]|uniref:Def4247a-fe4b-41ec-8b5b-ed2021feecd5-CDS n=1 Tax=Sclerotinia trifoliorum TaxID=28548 RepID=A0A8H2VWX0_9HELO|nr:def4247a-fe4b-41ec-8b5b-ed2021feecd5-CDS [Sclerotinia trifoliorum]
MDSIKTKIKTIARKRRIPSAELLVGLDYYAYERIPKPKTFLFAKSHPKKRPDALASSLLPRLPTEIIHTILSFLPAAAAACFSISCLQILELVGKGYMDNVLREKANILSFVFLWAKDLPSQIFCTDCKCLYKKWTLRYYLHRRSLISCCELERQISDYRMMARGVIDCDRISPMCPTMMDQFMLEIESPEPSINMDKSRYPIPMGDLRQSRTGNYVNHVRADVALVDGSVIFRLQDTYLNINPEKPYETMFQTCRHIQIQINTDKDSIHAFKLGSATGNYWRTNDFQIADNDAPKSSASFDCPAANCDDKYHIQFERHAGQGILVSLTRRVNLGTSTTGERWKEFCHVRKPIKEPDHTGRLVLTVGNESKRQHKLADAAYYIERYSLSPSAIRDVVLEAQRDLVKTGWSNLMGPRQIVPNFKSENS